MPDLTSQLKQEAIACGSPIVKCEKGKEFYKVKDLHTAYCKMIQATVSKDERIELLANAVQKLEAVRPYWWAKVLRLEAQPDRQRLADEVVKLETDGTFDTADYAEYWLLENLDPKRDAVGRDAKQ
jgi:hypothetical protein